MTIEEKVNYMRTMLGDDELKDEVAVVYLDLAKQKIINHIYPFDNTIVELESKYDFKQIELAIVLYNKRGVEGENSHGENGVSRNYQTEASILASIPRYAGLPK